MHYLGCTLVFDIRKGFVEKLDENGRDKSLWRSLVMTFFGWFLWSYWDFWFVFWYKDDILLAGRFSGRLFHYEWIPFFSNSWLENWERCSTIVMHQHLLMGVNKQPAFPLKCEIDILCVLFLSVVFVTYPNVPKPLCWTFLNHRALHRTYFFNLMFDVVYGEVSPFSCIFMVICPVFFFR